MSFYMIIHR